MVNPGNEQPQPGAPSLRARAQGWDSTDLDLSKLWLKNDGRLTALRAGADEGVRPYTARNYFAGTKSNLPDDSS